MKFEEYVALQERARQATVNGLLAEIMALEQENEELKETIAEKHDNVGFK